MFAECLSVLPGNETNKIALSLEVQQLFFMAAGVDGH